MKKIQKAKLKSSPILSLENIKDFISTLKIEPEQQKYLETELPTMDDKEKLELLGMLIKVYALNMEEEKAKQKLRDFMK